MDPGQTLINKCRDQLEKAGVHDFPVEFFKRSKQTRSRGGASGSGGGEEDADAEKFKDDVARGVMSLLYMINIKMDDYASKRQDAWQNEPGKKVRFIEESKNRKKPGEWYLVGPFDVPLFPETKYGRPFVEVGKMILVEMLHSLQLQRLQIRLQRQLQSFSDEHHWAQVLFLNYS